MLHPKSWLKFSKAKWSCGNNNTVRVNYFIVKNRTIIYQLHSAGLLPKITPENGNNNHRVVSEQHILELGVFGIPVAVTTTTEPFERMS